MHRYLDAGFHRYTFRRSFYGLVHFYVLLHKAKILSTKVGRIFALYSSFFIAFAFLPFFLFPHPTAREKTSPCGEVFSMKSLPNLPNIHGHVVAQAVGLVDGLCRQAVAYGVEGGGAEGVGGGLLLEWDTAKGVHDAVRREAQGPLRALAVRRALPDGNDPRARMDGDAPLGELLRDGGAVAGIGAEVEALRLLRHHGLTAQGVEVDGQLRPGQAAAQDQHPLPQLLRGGVGLGDGDGLIQAGDRGRGVGRRPERPLREGGL